MKYFLPDWDDRVDPGYDFLTDRPSYERDPYRDDVYAHELFGDEPCYDGLLVSRSALPERGPKRELIERWGFRRFYRLPPHMEIMGDCGAFGYIDDPVPRFETREVLDYYARLGVDYGISIDHIIVPAHADQRQFRYQLTIENAIEFLRLHRKSGARFVPVGAVQGWDAASYADCARRLVAEGYSMLAVGGLVRATTAKVREILGAIVASVGPRVRIHALGIAREGLLQELLGWGIYSCDSASPMRTAWTSATKNYLTPTGHYTAIRVPFSAPVPGIGTDNLVTRAGLAPQGELEEYERTALLRLREYERREASLECTLESLAIYDAHLARKGEDLSHQRRMAAYERTLRDRPWEKCRCAVCVAIGIEVVIFRGNNRNRRRGFHNVMTFYREVVRRRRTLRKEAPNA